MSNQAVRFHTRSHVDEILRLCEKSERWEQDDKEKKEAKGGDDRVPGAAAAGNPRRESRGSAGGIVMIDSDTAITPGSREAILRAAGAACFAVDEVGCPWKFQVRDAIGSARRGSAVTVGT